MSFAHCNCGHCFDFMWCYPLHHSFPKERRKKLLDGERCRETVTGHAGLEWSCMIILHFAWWFHHLLCFSSSASRVLNHPPSWVLLWWEQSECSWFFCFKVPSPHMLISCWNSKELIKSLIHSLLQFKFIFFPSKVIWNVFDFLSHP